ncbi:MAG: hypothetical protein ACOX2L_00415 [Anaerolineae bacterium]|jgi:hypothetical protein|nr:hypothetical protein [Chloroflexota bacterium]
MIVILDFDGTLTAEESQAPLLARRALTSLAREVLQVPRPQLVRDYRRTRRAIRARPWEYGWWVNGLLAGYPDEGAFQCNTVTLQTLLAQVPAYARRVQERFAQAQYDPIVDCTNWLFHRHTAELGTAFRPEALPVLQALLDDPQITPLVLTNSLGDKVARQLATLPLSRQPEILGDTRQYEMDPHWQPPLALADGGDLHWQVDPQRRIDLRRPDYFRALERVRARDPQLAVVADSLSLPGALPLALGIPFFLLRTPYTPDWCMAAVRARPTGRLLGSLSELPAALRQL